MGAADVLYDPEVVLAYWRELLSGASFSVIPDGGRFLAMTHPHLVVAGLKEAQVAPSAATTMPAGG